MTYNDLYMEIRRRLMKAEIASPALTAREIVCCAANKKKDEFYAGSNLYTSTEIEQRAQEMTERCLRGEPVAYLIGEWEFYGLPLVITKDVLIPRDDTNVLTERAIDLLKAAGDGRKRVLDLCTGSGCIGLAIAANVPSCRVVLADRSEAALQVARQNIRLNHLHASTAVFPVDALLPPPKNLSDIDCIVCNPPYIPTGDIAGLDISVKDYEPHMALDGGADGLDFYRSVAQKWKEILAPGGYLLFELGIAQADAVMRIMRTEGFGDLELTEDTQGISRVICGKRYTEI